MCRIVEGKKKKKCGSRNQINNQFDRAHFVYMRIDGGEAFLFVNNFEKVMYCAHTNRCKTHRNEIIIFQLWKTSLKKKIQKNGK